MKKLVAFLLIIGVCLSIASCAAAQSPTTQPNLENSVTTAPSAPSEPVTSIVATEPTEPETTAVPSTETVPVLPRGTIHITAPEDIFAENPEAAGDVQVHIEEGGRFIANLVDMRWHKCNYLFGNYFAFVIYPRITDPEFADMTMEYEATSNYEGFWRGLDSEDKYEGMETTFDQSVYWKPVELFPEPEELPDQIWIDVIVRANGQIVGMMVLAVESVDTGLSDVRLYHMYSEGYKRIDGKFQNVSEEFVRSRIEAYHQYGLDADREEKWTQQEAYWNAYVQSPKGSNE
jgi:hypothetical protein